MGSIIITGGAAVYPPLATTTVNGVLKLATNAQALAGTDNATAMTPLVAAAAIINSIASTPIATAGVDNTKLMTPLLTKAVITSKLSTNAQAIAGLDNSTLMTPQSAAAALTNQIGITVQGYDPTIVKTNVANTFTKQNFTPPIAGATSGNVVIDCDNNPDTYYDLTAPMNFANPTNIARGKALSIAVRGAQSITWGTLWRGNYDIDLLAAGDATQWQQLDFRCINGTQMTLIGVCLCA